MILIKNIKPYQKALSNFVDWYVANSKLPIEKFIELEDEYLIGSFIKYFESLNIGYSCDLSYAMAYVLNPFEKCILEHTYMHKAEIVFKYEKISKTIIESNILVIKNLFKLLEET